ncbi:MAG: DUF1273 family protein [Clostridia bacterium]|nr:DUF1273 family protein [Clostridia bacterium]
MSLTPKTCFFTGHRVISTKKRDKAVSWLREEILNKINDKVTVFIAGGAKGFDTMAAEQVIDMREDYSCIKLHLYLPCTNQDAQWNEDERRRFEEIKKSADKIYYITEGEYVKGCMRKRNLAMVEAADCGIAYLVNGCSGSAQTVKMAVKKGIKVVNIADKVRSEQ